MGTNQFCTMPQLPVLFQLSCTTSWLPFHELNYFNIALNIMVRNSPSIGDYHTGEMLIIFLGQKTLLKPKKPNDESPFLTSFCKIRAAVRQRYLYIHTRKSTGVVQKVISISSPWSYLVITPVVAPCLGDRMEEAWSLTLDPHFQSLPFALHSLPSLYEIW